MLLVVLGVALVVLGAYLAYRDRSFSSFSIGGLKITSGAWLLLIVVGVAAIMLVAFRQRPLPDPVKPRTLTIYSSLPERDIRGDEHSNERTRDMENAIDLALTEAASSLGRFTVK